MIPLMLAVSLSVAISRRISRHSMVEQQMMDEGYVEAKESSDPLANVKGAEAMTKNPLTVSADVTLLDAIRAVAGTRHRMYPVTDGDGKFAGVLSLDVIERAARDCATSRSVRESLEQPKLVAVASEPVIDVVRRMQMNGADRAPVVDESRKIVGFISPSDILRARMQHITLEEEVPFEIFE